MSRAILTILKSNLYIYIYINKETLILFYFIYTIQLISILEKLLLHEHLFFSYLICSCSTDNSFNILFFFFMIK